VGAFFKRGLFKLAGQSALCAADGGAIEKQAQVCGQAKPARMGDALAVDDKDIRLFLQLLDCGNADWGLAKGKQAGDVGEGYFSGSTCRFDRLKVAELQNDDGGEDFLAVFAEGAVNTCDRFGQPFQRRKPHSAGQAFLYVSGLRIR